MAYDAALSTEVCPVDALFQRSGKVTQQGRWPFYVTTKLDFEEKTFFREQGGGVILTFADKVKLTTFLSSKLHLKISFQCWLVLKDRS